MTFFNIIQLILPFLLLYGCNEPKHENKITEQVIVQQKELTPVQKQEKLQ